MVTLEIPGLGTCTAPEERWREVHAQAKAMMEAIEAGIPELAPMAGDVTGDGKVDAFDLGEVAANWQKGV